MKALPIVLVIALLAVGVPAEAQDHSDFNTPYAGVHAASGKRPLLVVLLKPRDDRFLEPKQVSLFGLDAAGHCTLTRYSLEGDGVGPTGWYAPPSVTGMPKTHRFAAGPAVVNHPDGLLQAVFAVGRDGIVYQTYAPREGDTAFEWQPWSSLPDNVRLTGTPSVVDHSAGRVQAVFARGRDDGLVYAAEYRRGDGSGWSFWVPLPRTHRFTAGPAVVPSQDGRELNVFAVDSDGVVHRAVRDVTSHRGWGPWRPLPSNARILGGLSALSSAIGPKLLLAARGRDGEMYAIEATATGWNPWQPLPTGVDLVHGVTLMSTADESGVLAYATARDGTVHYSWRTYPFPGIPWEPWRPVDVRKDPVRVFSSVAASPALLHLPSPQRVREMFFGGAPSVADLYLRNSYGEFTFTEAAVTPWLTAVDDPTTPHQDESSYAYVHGSAEEEKAAYVLRAAATEGSFPFSNFDRDNDGQITEEDLCVYWIYPGGGDARGRETAPETVSVPGLPPGGGVRIRYLVRSGTKAGVATAAHELGHQAFGLPDLYAAKDDGFVGVGVYSLMGNEGSGNFLDPWTRMKLGWLRPTVMTKNAEVTLLDSKRHGDAVILFDPRRGFREYFIVENRQPDPVYESGLNSQGLAVWRIHEYHDDEGDGHWGRKTIHLRWAGGDPGSVNDASDHALFDALDARSLYDLTENSAPANSRWTDGSDSGIRIRGIPPASGAMKIRIEVP